MSGIFGYIGNRNCKDSLVCGIKLLEKRGSDMSGFALKINEEILSIKVKGNADVLSQEIKDDDILSFAGIAQTGRAYRCKASDASANPSSNNLFAVAMDGIIDNFDSLKHWCANPFPINTDEDLLLALLCITNSSDKTELLIKTDSMLMGNPTYAFVCNNEDAVYCKKGNAPLVIGMASDGFFISSEINALIPFASKYILLGDGEFARITKNKASVFDINLKKIKKSLLPVPEKSYIESNYILSDEIYYCPLTVKETYNNFVKNSKLSFEYIKMTHRSIDRLSRIIITGSSGSFNVAKISGYNFEMLTDIPTFVRPAGELRYSGTVMDKNTLLIAISHRGENEDTISCVKRAQAFGAKTIAVTNNSSSYLALLCNEIINPGCDFDCGDISLRSFVSNYLAMCFLSLYIGWKNSVVTELYLNVAIKMAEMLPGKISASVKNTPLLEKAANKILCSKNVFVAGLGADWALSYEAAQKLREISRINAGAYCISELINTASCLLDSSSLIVALITNKELMQKSLRYLRYAKTTGAKIIIVTTANIEEEITDFDNIISFNDSVPIFNALPCITGIYKLAVIINDMRNQNDIDKVG